MDKMGTYRKCACGKSKPLFGLPGDTRAEYCSVCPTKPVEAMDIISRRCVCRESSRPVFGFPDDKMARWCSLCRPNGTENIKSRRCVCWASTNPVFGHPGDKIALWCKKCPTRPAGAENIVSPRCVCGSSAEPSFGLPGDDKARFCKKCPTLPAGAENIRSRRCACGLSQPSHGMPGDKRANWCAKCPMIPAGAENIKSSRCLSTFCNTIVQKPINREYCLHCFVHLFPDEVVSRNYKVKETIVREAVEGMLQEGYPHLEFSFDKSIAGGCSKKRPDTFIDALTHIVCGEVDEEAHNTAEYCSCENKRMMGIVQDNAFRPAAFIRLNPDAFTDSKGKKHKSCFKKTKSGKLVVADQKELDFRIKVYLDRLKHHLDNVPDKQVEIEHLFYDGFAV